MRFLESASILSMDEALKKRLRTDILPSTFTPAKLPQLAPIPSLQFIPHDVYEASLPRTALFGTTKEEQNTA